MRLDAEVVATGDELMTGAIQDSNSAYLCGRLREEGVRVRRVTIVGDAQGDIEQALREASARAKVVVVGGGLGPTEDDRSAAAAAAVAGVELVRDEAALEHIRDLFRRFAKQRNQPDETMPPNNAKQADFPAGAEVLPNPNGTAPGFAVTLGDARAFFLPGVPGEMRPMFERSVLPQVRALREAQGGATALATRVVKTYGYGESKVEHLLRGVEWPAEVTVGYRAKHPEIHLRLYAEGDAPALTGALDRAEALIRERLGVRVFGVDEDTFPSVLGRLLAGRGWKLAVAESCTGGLLGSLLTEVPGASAWFDRGFVTYSYEAKTALLGVPADVLVAQGAVSEAAVEAMAAGALKASGCDMALAITGIAGPEGGTPDKPVGTVWIACATGVRGATRGSAKARTVTGIESRRLALLGDRQRIRVGSAFAAMDLARRALLDDAS